MSSKALPKRKNPLQAGTRNEAIVLLAASSGRTVGFIVKLGSRSIPFGNPVAEKYNDSGNVFDTLMDGSFLPFDADSQDEMGDIAFDDRFNNLGNRLQRGIHAKRLTGNHLSELEYFMQDIHLTEN